MKKTLITLILVLSLKGIFIACQVKSEQNLPIETDNNPDTSSNHSVLSDIDTIINIDTIKNNWTVTSRIGRRSIIPHPSGKYYFKIKTNSDTYPNVDTLYKYNLKNHIITKKSISAIFNSDISERVANLYKKEKLRRYQGIATDYLNQPLGYSIPHYCQLYYNDNGIGILIQGGFTEVFDFVTLDWNLKIQYKFQSLREGSLTYQKLTDLFIGYPITSFYQLSNGNFLLEANPTALVEIGTNTFIIHKKTPIVAIDSKREQNYQITSDKKKPTFHDETTKTINIAFDSWHPRIRDNTFFAHDIDETIYYVDFHKKSSILIRLKIVYPKKEIDDLFFFPIQGQLFICGNLGYDEPSFVGFTKL